MAAAPPAAISPEAAEVARRSYNAGVRALAYGSVLGEPRFPGTVASGSACCSALWNALIPQCQKSIASGSVLGELCALLVSS